MVDRIILIDLIFSIYTYTVTSWYVLQLQNMPKYNSFMF